MVVDSMVDDKEMVNHDSIQRLIEQKSEVEKNFKKEVYAAFSTSDIKTRKRSISAIRCEMIYKSPAFIAWRDELVYELSKLKKDTLVEEILNLCQRFVGVGDKRKFNELSSKLSILKDHLGEYEIDYDRQIKDDRISETELSDKVLQALKMQRNHHYDRNSSEDTMNDYIRDILDENYKVKDQTRQGDSTRGDEAGEVDIQICDSDFPIVMIEGVKLNSVVKRTLDTHIRKILINYDPNGCPYAFILVYSTVDRFDDFCEKLFDYLLKYNFPFERKTDFQEKETNYSELRHFQTILLRSGKNVRLHFYVVHIK